MTKPTVLTDKLNFTDYVRLEAVHATALKHMLVSPLYYQTMQAEQRQDTDAMRVGRAVHVMVTHPAAFETDFAVWNGGRRYGKLWDAFCEQNAGKTHLTEKQAGAALAMATSIKEHKIAPKYLSGGLPEVTIQWHIDEYNFRCKSRIDYLPQGAITEIKTTKNVSPSGYAREVIALGYALQCAFYQDAVLAATGKKLPVKMVAVQNVRPYDVVVYNVTDETINFGRSQYIRALRLLDECTRSGIWPGYAREHEVDLALPPWAVNQEDRLALDPELAELSGDDELEVANG